jgi:hypothetical protein
MAVNPLGAVVIADGGAPRVISGYAREVISGGQFLGASGIAGVVSSGTDSFATKDIEFFITTGSGNFVGIALNDAASGGILACMTRGLALVPVSGPTNVLAGMRVGCNNVSDVIALGSSSVTVAGQIPLALTSVGRALTAGSNLNYVILDVGA